MYNWQQKDWKNFQYNLTEIEDLLLVYQEQIGTLKGTVHVLSEKQKIETLVDMLVTEAIKNTEIEGEFVSREDVMSSIKNNLGIYPKVKNIKDLRAKGMATVVTEVHKGYQKKLTEKDLFNWHKLLFPYPTKLNIGTWRSHENPMQIISGSYGKEKIHFEAPPSQQVPEEMKDFIHWFNDTAPKGENTIKYAPIRSALSHLYFESIHPFEDGNGRIGRAIAEKSLLQTIGSPILISLSASIESDRKAYYLALKKAQKSNQITDWLKYFIGVIIDAQKKSEELIHFTLKKAKLFDRHQESFNTRQTKILKKMLEKGPEGFEGGMSAKKYMKITKTSKATATRDIQQLVKLGIFVAQGGGRSTSYSLHLSF
ncbi:MAG: Fic family protein [Flavobacteriales bacterium]|jgi:Fic family protein|nr:Fic family protein [Flavobacteriales bacterium]